MKEKGKVELEKEEAKNELLELKSGGKEDIKKERKMKEEKKKEASELGRQKAAQAWCTPETEGTEMDPELAKAFARIIDEIWSLPWLGNATTKELLDEITARIEMDGKLDYRTVDIPVRKENE